MDDVEPINYSLVLSLVVCLTALFTELFVFYSRLWLLDSTAVITLLLYLVSIFLKLFRFFIKDVSGTAFSMALGLLCNSLIELAMYYFVFEMRTVMDQLKSNDSYDYIQR